MDVDEAWKYAYHSQVLRTMILGFNWYFRYTGGATCNLSLWPLNIVSQPERGAMVLHRVFLKVRIIGMESDPFITGKG
ncbi:hypothetical protein FJTKL_09392 [Diaporthe vaccinii]|uniref:Uncharacterized protein n=1 Tax=Diaporthe vaccinii TaxID=105482 RepID=A0ABR4FD00_9PEZI